MDPMDVWQEYNEQFPNTLTFSVLDAALDDDEAGTVKLLQTAIDSGDALSDSDLQDIPPGVYL